MKQYNKPRKSQILFSLGFVVRLGFFGGVFLAYHLASIDNLNQNNQKTEHTLKRGPNKQQHNKKNHGKIRERQNLV